MVCFQGTQEWVRINRGERAINVRAIEGLLNASDLITDAQTVTVLTIMSVPLWNYIEYFFKKKKKKKRPKKKKILDSVGLSAWVHIYGSDGFYRIVNSFLFEQILNIQLV